MPTLFIEYLNDVILVASFILLVSIATSALAFRYGAPLLLVFLGIGLLCSANGVGFIHFTSAPLAYGIGSIAIAYILFESGLEADLAHYRLAAAPAITLATLGVLITAVFVAIFVHWLLNLSWSVALLLGAIVSPTDTAAVSVLLRVGGIHIRNRVRSALEIESAMNDPFSIMLTLTFMSGLAYVQKGDTLNPNTPPDLPLLKMGTDFAMQAGLGLIFGLAGGRALTMTLNRIHIDVGLYPVLSMMSVLVVFSVTSLAGGSGFLAVYIAGMALGNMRVRNAQSLRRFHNGISWLSQIVMFVTLGLLAHPEQFTQFFLPALLIAIALIFVARPVAVWLCLLPFRFTPNEKTFLGWVGLRGAVSILLAILAVVEHQPYADAAFTLTFLVVVLSLLMQGWTIKGVARWLRLVVPEQAGPAERVELDLPLEDNAAAVSYELLGYNVREGSIAGGGGKLPRWAKPSLLIRDGRVVNPKAARQVRVGDHVYLFSPHNRVPLLDRLFAGEAHADGDTANAQAAFFGDLAVKPDVPLGELAERYSFTVPDEKRDMTVAELFIEEFDGRYDIGDRLHFGLVDLVVRAVSGNRITAVGIALPPIEPVPHRLRQMLSPDELIASIRDLWWRLSRKGGRDEFGS